jgi:class 3 adenylate cyclase/predicted ATPase
MFVDLVGSTALSARLDPEDLRRIIRGYQDVVAAEAARYEAHVAQYLGDGAMVCFGYPIAHEDDAERAVRAAIAIMRELSCMRPIACEALAARIGIATGLVVVGDLLGTGAARERAVVGETPNLAARLQTLAGAGEIIVSDKTRTLIGSLFELHELGLQQLRGVNAPIPAFRVDGERVVSSRFEARHISRPGAMVGRDCELARLRDLWRAACNGEGQFALLTGEAGIGKSRTVHALLDSLDDKPLCLHHQCSPYHSDSPLFPVTQQIAHAARVLPGDPAETTLDRLETLLAGTPPEEIALVAALLGVDGAVRYGTLDLTPPQQRLRTFDALVNRLVRLTEAQPIVWVLEDAHWIDPTTLELLQRHVQVVGRLRLLVIVTARPEFRFNLGPLTRIDLGRLNRVHATAIVNGLARGKRLPTELLREIVAKADGVPLFVEELTKAMLESGAVRETEHAFIVDHALQRVVVPASLHDSLMARLDRLQPFKEVAQTAACIGREFEFRLLASVSRLPKVTLRAALLRLEEAGLIFGRGGPRRSRYVFKHALVRDAAYESLLNENRRHIHARLASELECTAGTAPELIAQHAAQAGLTEKAIEYWQKAATQSVARPAYREAIAHLTQAIVLADTMGPSRPWQECRLSLWMALGQASIPLYGYSHSKTAAVFARAQELAEATGDSPHRFWIQYATWVARYVRGEQDAALETACRMMEQSESNESLRLSALRALGISQMVTGTPLKAQVTFQEAQQLAEVLRERSTTRRTVVANRFAADPEIASQFHAGLTLWSLGRIDEAHALVSCALTAAREMGHAHTFGHAVTHGAIFSVVTRDVTQALALSSEAIEFAEKRDMELWRGYGCVLHGYALALQGNAVGSMAAMNKGFASLEHTHTGAMVPLHHAMQARTLAKLGHFEQARAHAAVAEKELRTGSERYFWPETQRLLGDYLVHCKGAAMSEVEEAYERAISLARGQQAVSWQLYAVTSLARSWASRGEHRRALELTAPLLAMLRPSTDWAGRREADDVCNMCSSRI